MARKYIRKTNQLPQGERELTLRADLHDPPDLDKLTELLIRLALQQSGQHRAVKPTRPPHPSATGAAST